MDYNAIFVEEEHESRISHVQNLRSQRAGNGFESGPRPRDVRARCRILDDYLKEKSEKIMERPVPGQLPEGLPALIALRRRKECQ
jgi:hypothetical protein